MEINTKDLVISTFRKSGQGGWNTSPEMGVRITHTPSGLFVQEDEDRSVHRNKAVAFQKLTKLLETGIQLELFQTEMQPVLVYNTYKA